MKRTLPVMAINITLSQHTVKQVCNNLIQITTNKNTVRIISVMIGLYLLVPVNYVYSAHPVIKPDPGITIVSPPQGTQAAPGSTVRVVVDVDTGLYTPTEVIAGSANMRFGVPSTTDNAAPYELDLVMPARGWMGVLDIAIIVKTATDSFSGPDLRLEIVPETPPTKLEFSNPHYIIDTPVNPALASQRKLRISAQYPDGETRSLENVLSDVSFVSNNPSVVTVDEVGQMTVVAPGTTYITATFAGISEFVEVNVLYSNGELPIMEYTDNVSISASGFKKDINSGLYIQQLELTNTGSLPIPRPVRLIVNDLPAGVHMLGASGTKNITPLGSDYLSIDMGSSTFWLPGATVPVKLAFRNDDGRPITYTPRIFTAIRP